MQPCQDCNIWSFGEQWTLHYIFGITARSQVKMEMNGNGSRATSPQTNPTSIILAIQHHTAKNTLTPLWVKLHQKAMYFLLYKLNSISAAPTHSSCILYFVRQSWRADHMEPPQQCCCSTSAWSGAEIVLLPRGGRGRFGGDRVGKLGAGGREQRGNAHHGSHDSVASLNNLHPEGPWKFYPVSRPCSCMNAGE